MNANRNVLRPLSAGLLLTLITLASVCSSLAQILNPPMNPMVPVVTIRATDPSAAWTGGDGGEFTVFRQGPTNAALNIFYRIGGTAANGVDFGEISNWISIAAGERTNVITIKPIDAGQSVSKTVQLQLAYPPTMPPINYQIGLASNAMVVIRAAAPTNLPPAVSLLSPANGATFPAGAEIQLCAEARDADGDVHTVEFFAGTRSLGIRTNNPASAGPLNPFCLVWSNVPPGAYVLTARATDNAGAISTSAPVRVEVSRLPPLPLVSVLATDPNASEPGVLTVMDPGVFTIVRDHGTNAPMQVFYSLRGSASNGLDYVLLSNSVVIPAGALSARVLINPLMDKLTEGTETVVLHLEPVLCAAIFPPPPGCYQVGTLSEARVFIADSGAPPTNRPPLVRLSSPPNGALFRAPVTIPLFAYARDAEDAVATVEFSAGTNRLGYGQPLSVSNAMPMAAAYSSNSFMLIWSNAPLGTHTLTAKATDRHGAWSVSDSVRISILPAPPPPTNRPTLVSIVAIDPMAIEGTNCWVWRGVTNPQPSWTSWSAASFRSFTNCGPKNATFALHRIGATNDTLTVGYAIAGTATNGMDYLPLSGVVTFRPGERSVLLPVVPIDDGSPEINRTVVLRLKPSSQVPPDYLVGSPRGAAAIILDSNRPRPVSGLLPDKSFHVNAAGPDGAWFRVEYSSNMLDWTVLCTNQVINGSIDFIDPEAQSDQCRFYRTVPENSPTQ